MLEQLVTEAKAEWQKLEAWLGVVIGHGEPVSSEHVVKLHAHLKALDEKVSGLRAHVEAAAPGPETPVEAVSPEVKNG